MHEHDYHILASIVEAGYQFPDLKFKGPGWYKCNEDYILVRPTENSEKFDCYVYHGRNPIRDFQVIANYPRFI